METSLDKIIKTYVLNELKFQRPERENGDSDKRNRKPSDNEEILSDGKNEEYVDALHECLERKGIMRELQAFLRQKMVLILQEKWPKLIMSPPTEAINRTVIKLFEDFLCTRRLLYTFSVLSSELGLKSTGKVKWGKMSCRDAEKLLEKIDIQKDSQLSRRILKFYSDKQDFSLLECIIQTTGWSERPDQYPTDGDHISFNLTNTKGTGTNNRPQKFGVRLKQIDEFFDKKQNQGDVISNLGADERFRAIEKCLEEDKKIQLQLAIKKFKEEEVERIKEELEHKMRFQMLTKENVLLVNYKEKSALLKDNFEREKSIWLAEKFRQEQEMEQKRQELEVVIGSVTKAQDNMQTKTKEVKLDGNKLLEEIKVTDTSLTKHYEKVDDFLMREAELRVKVKRLQEENERLVVEREKKSQEKARQIAITSQIPTQPERTSQNLQSNVQKVDTDAIAFLQYNLEHQAEEIKYLKQQLYLDKQKQIAPSPANGKPSEIDSSELINFLAESKQRCHQIEEDSRSVEKKLHDIQMRTSRSCSPISRSYQYSKIPPPGPFSSMSKMLIEQIQPLQHSQPQVRQLAITDRPVQLQPVRGIPTFSTPTKESTNFDDSWIKPMIRASNVSHSIDEDQIRHAVQQVRRESQHYHIKENNDSQPKDHVLESAKLIASSTSGTNNHILTTSTVREEITITPSKNKITSRNNLESEKVEKAVRKGALSFEKVSSDGESSLCSSIRQDASSRSHSRNKVQKSKSLENQKVDLTRKEESTDKTDIGSETTRKNIEPEEVSIEEKSLPISAVSGDFDISHGGSMDKDDEFWKL